MARIRQALEDDTWEQFKRDFAESYLPPQRRGVID